MDRISQLRQQIQVANVAYRTGTASAQAMVSDEQYDLWIDELKTLDPNDSLLEQIGLAAQGPRKEKLPHPMFSMNKLKNIDELLAWAKLKQIPVSSLITITPKYDGLSLSVHESQGSAWTRGNGIEGSRSDSHFEMMLGKRVRIISRNYETCGEAIMPKKIFAAKYQKGLDTSNPLVGFENARNMIAGLLNRDDPSPELRDAHYIRYSIHNSLACKQDQLRELNTHVNTVAVPFQCIKLLDINQALLEKLYAQWSVEYEIDGLILEVDDAQLRQKLGRETNSNPAYARAYKGFALATAITEIIAIEYNVSKNGNVVPRGHVRPVRLDGVTISHVTLNNTGNVKKCGLGIGAQVEIVRAGQVIPKVERMLQPVAAQLPSHCPSCRQHLIWDENDTHLVCTNSRCPDQLKERILMFFVIMEMDAIGPGILDQLWNAGYRNLKSILSLSVSQLAHLDGFGIRRAQMVHDGIHSKLQAADLAQIQYASCLFRGLGTRKLELLKHYNSSDKVPSLGRVTAIAGFSDRSAQIYIEAFPKFWEWLAELPITLQLVKPISQTIGTATKNWKVCFTGVRDKNLEHLIIAHGGEITDNVRAGLTYLVCKDTNSSSSKAQKAHQLGAAVIAIDDFQNLLNQRITNS